MTINTYVIEHEGKSYHYTEWMEPDTMKVLDQALDLEDTDEPMPYEEEQKLIELFSDYVEGNTHS